MTQSLSKQKVPEYPKSYSSNIEPANPHANAADPTVGNEEELKFYRYQERVGFYTASKN